METHDVSYTSQSQPSTANVMENVNTSLLILFAFVFTVLILDNLKEAKKRVYLQFDMKTVVVQNTVAYNTTKDRVPGRMKSACSRTATKRGPHQRVVSYCLHDDVNIKNKTGRNYFTDIEANAELVEEMYPSWIMRLYHDIPYSNGKAVEILNSLQRRFKNLDVCYYAKIPGYGNIIGAQQMLWRFLPMGDPLVDVFLSRDLDSRISDREVKAVEEWLDSGLTFHVMRDHPYHHFPVLAGMWGARLEGSRELLLTLMAQMFVRGRSSKHEQEDQLLLGKVAWPAMAGLTMQHDSYHCRRFRRHGGMRPWPTIRLGLNQTEMNFVGSVYTKPAELQVHICPLACRSTEHKDWTLC